MYSINSFDLMDGRSLSFLQHICSEYAPQHQIPASLYEKYGVKRGLRNADGTGVMAGITNIANVRGYYLQDGERVPAPGQLIYRGIDVCELIEGFLKEGRFGYEETAYLLLFGSLPSKEELSTFQGMLNHYRNLPPGFTEDMILKGPSRDLMNKLARSTLSLYSYDPDPDNNNLDVELFQAIQLIARFPVIVAHAYACKRHYFDNESLVLHRPQDGLSVAENFLCSIRPDKKFSQAEARLLDLCLVLHMDHGGGNNSAFTCRVLSSTGTDTYGAISGAVNSLKGPLHGGANAKVMEMFHDIRDHIHDPADEEEVYHYLKKILDRQAGDKSGKIYGLGHAVYTISDPRTLILKQYARALVESKGCTEDFNLMETIERQGLRALSERLGDRKRVCANLDMYSGLIYQTLGIPEDLFTPLFAIARIAGWCAHRIEEVCTGGRIIRPAYRAMMEWERYVPMNERCAE